MHSIITFFSNLRWQDIIDILLNSYILFRFYILFRGTQTFRVLMGIILLWFFQKIAVSLGLVVTSWVIQGITAVGALIIVVIFRNEIRNVFQAKDLKAIFWGLPERASATPVQTIVDAVFSMSERHIGALMVFPGRHDLSDMVQNGVPLEGIISKDMLLSVFWEGNPVHDGAMIIERNRISTVGCILPLSRRDDLTSQYGTRHRAALGLAEVSDALIIVVSEERGTVSVAKSSRLSTVSSKKELKRIIQKHTGILGEETEKKEKFTTAFAAVISLLFISSVWFSFTSGRDTLISLDIPITYRNQKPGMEIIKTSSNTVQVHLSGSGALIKTITPMQVNVNISLGDAVVGENTLPILHKDITIPPGIILDRVDPSEVDVFMDVIVTRDLPVQVEWDGHLSDLLMMTDVKVTPDTVRITGQSLLLNEMSTAYTEKISLDDIGKSGRKTVGLAIDPSLKLANGNQRQVIIEYITVKRNPHESAK